MKVVNKINIGYPVTTMDFTPSYGQLIVGDRKVSSLLLWQRNESVKVQFDLSLY